MKRSYQAHTHMVGRERLYQFLSGSRESCGSLQGPCPHIKRTYVDGQLIGQERKRWVRHFGSDCSCARLLFCMLAQVVGYLLFRAVQCFLGDSSTASLFLLFSNKMNSACSAPAWVLFTRLQHIFMYYVVLKLRE